MDYKEKYEMALEGIQEILGSGEDSIKMSRLQLRLQGIFPELRISEDEKIRKELLDAFKKSNDSLYLVLTPLKRERFIAYLEKQGKEDLPIQQAYEWGYTEGKRIERKHWVEKQKFSEDYNSIDPQFGKPIEQNPAWSEAGEDMKEALRTEYEKGRADAFAQMQKEWSEEDESILQGIGDEILANKHNAKECEWKTYDKFLDWLKAIKDRYSWKPSSELDETSYQVGIKRVLENPESYGLTKYNWKPSDKQMHAFEQVYDWYNNNFAPSETLTSLYKDLEKLKGE